MGMFDDLVPAAPTPGGGGGMFDDLVPAAPAPVQAAAPDPVPETPDTDAAPLSWMQYAEGLAQKVAQGVTFNYGDEAAALAGSLGGLGPMIGGKDYDTILAEVRGREKEFETAQPKTALAAEIGGSLAPGIGTGVTAARALARLGARPGLMRSTAAAGATAAPLGALNATGELEGDKSIGDYTDAAIEGGGTAALFGAGIGAAGHGLARVVGPWASAAAQRLHDQGIRLTPGQLMGPNAKRIEDVVTSLPGANIMVRGRRDEALSDLNRVAINRTLEPINRQLAPNVEMGFDAVAAAGDEISGAYNRAIPRMQGFRDQAMDNQLAGIAHTLPQNQTDNFINYVARELNNVTNQTSGVPIAGDDMQHLIGTFRDEANRLMTNSSATHHDRELGRAFGHAADEIETNLLAHSPQDAVDEFMAANRAFAMLVRVEKAAGMSDEGIFTPAHLKNAVRTSDKSSRKRAVARGDALMQDLGSDAQVVMGRTLNDSGTPERAMMSTLIAGGGAAAIDPTLLLGPAALAALYSGPAARVFRAGAAGAAGPRRVARDYLERFTNAAAPALGYASTQGE